jgi:DNA-binding LytR/AlgR family response regulator
MPDLSGMDIAGSLNKNTLVIFTTAYKEYAIEGFELDVVDYLLKPFDYNRFLKAYTKAEERFQTALKKSAPEVLNDEIITFKCSYQNVKLPLHTVQYIEGFDNYIKIVTPEKTYMPVMTMKYIEQLLPETRFVRVHKSFIIPVDKIKSFNRERGITDRMEAPVGRTYRREFMEKMEALKRGN